MATAVEKNEPITGQTFAQTTGVISRCKRVVYEVAKLNCELSKPWRQNAAGEFFFRLIIPVKIETMDVADKGLALAMIAEAQRILADRAAALEPDDGVERVDVKGRPREPIYSQITVNDRGFPVEGHMDMRTKEGRAWKAAQRGPVRE